MADTTNDTQKVISRQNAGFPDWLDFDRLRIDSMEYLGNLSGKIWTDHNTHDPGITILETLCYAVMDLGYRSSLPSKDLFATNPDIESAENNFFTPAQVLTCNPLTITDFRKLLIDIEGVRNAWLTVAEDISTDGICGRKYLKAPLAYRMYNPNPVKSSCLNFLNGLYHVLIEPEKEELTETEKEKLKKHIHDTLAAHRNLCEDFYDITFLCIQKVGICADIELDNTVQPLDIYPQLVNTLRDFFSAAPNFYRLQDLLDKGRKIEDIYAGRPTNLVNSHGFIDTEELEKMTFKKEIHLSDLYNAILQIKGINAARNISIVNCDGTRCLPGQVTANQNNPWIFHLYENHSARYHTECSGFRFTRNGQELPFQLSDANKQLPLAYSNKQFLDKKNLDLSIPNGVYRPDIADYLPIENEFPKVYGITDGSLLKDSSDARKAQSLQLRGYLLFFDVLLSGYLSQLKNIRQLFSFRDDGSGKTYFSNKLPETDGLKKLLGIDPEKTGSSHHLAYPVNIKLLQKLIANGSLPACDPSSQLPPYHFRCASERDNAIRQFAIDFESGNFSEFLLQSKKNCWVFYLQSSVSQIVLMSTEQFKTEQAARAAIASLQYHLSVARNYRTSNDTEHSRYSFRVATMQYDYWDYLQMLTENETRYTGRRNQFLDHLLARFAETFTDYALLSAPFLQPLPLQKENIRQKEAFLQSFPDLSSNRGKAYDYTLDGWNNNNVSGFEKRVTAYAGMPAAGLNNLCHFEVLEYEEQTVVQLHSGQQLFFSSEQPFESREEGKEEVRNLLKSMQDVSNYSLSAKFDKMQLSIRSSQALYEYPHLLTEPEAKTAVSQFARMTTTEAYKEDIQPSRYRHHFTLQNKASRLEWSRKEPIYTTEKNFSIPPDFLSDFADGSHWEAIGEEKEKRPEHFVVHPDDPSLFMQSDNLVPYFNRIDVRDRTDIFQFTLSDTDKSFFFLSESDYADELESKKDLTRLQFLLADEKNYIITETGKLYSLQIIQNGKKIATNKIEVPSPEEAKKDQLRLTQYFLQRLFQLTDDTKEDLYRYTLVLGKPGSPEFHFSSLHEYPTWEEAFRQGSQLALLPDGLTVTLTKKQQLQLKKEDHVWASHNLAESDDPKLAKKQAEELIELKKRFNKISLDPKSDIIHEMVKPAPVSEDGNFGYRLVKKDGYYARLQLDGDYSDKKAKKAAIKSTFQEFINESPHLDICYGGNIFREIVDKKTGASWYHFQVKSNEGDLVLFESASGYPSKEKANEAFRQSYADILKLALDINQYGQSINFEEEWSQSRETCANSAIKVNIPDATMKRYSYNREAAAKDLSRIAASFPVRIISPTDELFSIYFPCADIKTNTETGTNCQDLTPKYYYFEYTSPKSEKVKWISTNYYSRPEEANKAFHFFLSLLRYRGNYHVDYKECDRACQWQLYIREVLAVSAHRYPDRPTAWGEKGVQKFITVSQSKGAFNSYFDPQRCQYTFNVACGEMGLIHPCQYETADLRDKALEKLITAAMRWNDDFNSLTGPFWEEVTSKLEEFVIYRQKKDTTPCTTIQEIISIIRKTESGTDSEDKVIRQFNNLSQEKKQAVFALINNFPIKQHATNNKFYLEIKFPGFGYDEKNRTLQSSIAGNDTDGCNECSCLAWVSECCFDTCQEALLYYYHSLKCLANPGNYLPVYECECGPYGIRFFCKCHSDTRQKTEREVLVTKDCCNEIEAYNPNSYPTPSLACDAITRARRLINAEGLHTVEHILLRPHCHSQDQSTDKTRITPDCQCLINTCSSLSDCTFEWIVPSEDPCDKDKSYCFTPGADPYSFIATVLLPAWPERFRRAENRALIEKRLYQEAPSHIMLRILWVSPKDLCEFEYLYKNWIKWLSHKTICGPHDTPCDLIRFLFARESMGREDRKEWVFECFKGEYCIPCKEEVQPVNPCFSRHGEPADSNLYVNTINNLYCWKEICPRPKLKRELKSLSAKGKSDLEEEELSAERLIDARLNSLRELSSQITKNSLNNLAGKTSAFLLDPRPSAKAYATLMRELIENKTAEPGEELSKAFRKKLVIAATWYFFDTTLLNHEPDEKLKDLKHTLAKLKKNDLLPEYESWNEKELRQIDNEVDVERIKKLFNQLS